MMADHEWVHGRKGSNVCDGETYPTRAAAISGFAEYCDVSPGTEFWTGLISKFGRAELAGAMFDVPSMLETVGIYMYDNGGDVFEEGLDVSNAAEADLTEVLQRAIESWLDRHDISHPAARIVDIQTHVVPPREDAR